MRRLGESGGRRGECCPSGRRKAFYGATLAGESKLTDVIARLGRAVRTERLGVFNIDFQLDSSYCYRFVTHVCYLFCGYLLVVFVSFCIAFILILVSLHTVCNAIYSSPIHTFDTALI